MVTKPENFILAVRRQLLAALLVHRCRVQRGTLSEYSLRGLCFAVTKNSKGLPCLDLFAAIYKEWSKFSGNPLYPVPPGGLCQNPDTAYHYAQTNVGNMYAGSYGALRLELLDFCIDYLKPITRWTPHNGD